MVKLSDYKVGFIGGGCMAEAIIRGMVKNVAIYGPSRVHVYDILPARRDYFKNDVGCQVNASVEELISECEAIVVAIRPQDMDSLMTEDIKKSLANKVIISIVGGKSIAFYQELLHPEAKVIRIMPNTPATLGFGMTAVCPAKYLDSSISKIAVDVFESVGEVVVIDEDYIDRVTAISGCGPAYVFYLAECMMDRGIKEGLTREQALKLTAQTFMGAAHMIKSAPQGDGPGQLRENVCSPGGATIEGVKCFMAADLPNTVGQASQAIQKRLNEL
eukprot:GCRY01000219.1.p1 GENE.GCRY01000219.1~~GCRY01000219.1.p1  ORF type:complete len:291 (+),score=44.82 GCRY01000219.1:53-874(+)